MILLHAVSCVYTPGLHLQHYSSARTNHKRMHCIARTNGMNIDERLQKHSQNLSIKYDLPIVLLTNLPILLSEVTIGAAIFIAPCSSLTTLSHDLDATCFIARMTRVMAGMMTICTGQMMTRSCSMYPRDVSVVGQFFSQQHAHVSKQASKPTFPGVEPLSIGNCCQGRIVTNHGTVCGMLAWRTSR